MGVNLTFFLNIFNKRITKSLNIKWFFLIQKAFRLTFPAIETAPRSLYGNNKFK